MGGAMGLNADATEFNFNAEPEKGPIGTCPRVQCDKRRTQFRMKAILEAQNLDVKQGTVSRVIERRSGDRRRD